MHAYIKHVAEVRFIYIHVFFHLLDLVLQLSALLFLRYMNVCTCMYVCMYVCEVNEIDVTLRSCMEK